MALLSNITPTMSMGQSGFQNYVNQQMQKNGGVGYYQSKYGSDLSGGQKALQDMYSDWSKANNVTGGPKFTGAQGTLGPSGGMFQAGGRYNINNQGFNPDVFLDQFRQSPLAGVQYQQQQNLNQFDQNMPNMRAALANQLAQQTSQGTMQGLRSVRAQNSARGMLYGGVNAGQEGQVRGMGQSQYAQGLSNINQQLTNTEQGLRSGAIKTGVDMQQMQQQLANSNYQQAMADYTGGMNAVGGMAQMGLLAAMVL